MAGLTILLLCVAVTACIYGIWATVSLRQSKHALRVANERVFSHHQGPLAETEQEKARMYRQRADEALDLTHTFQKFVPRQFVDHLAKSQATELRLGHAAEDEVAILFCDIRGFSGLSEIMQPQQLMRFLNSYFCRMNEPIHQNRGFIDKFIGDAIMALFDHPGGTAKQKAADALQAALDLRVALSLYNEHRAKSGYEPLGVGIGLHFGDVILGTVGSEDRMDTTVIGDSVNIAYRLETLTPRFNADIIISEQMRDILGDSPGLQTRLLDWVRVKGRRAPLRIYEVLNHLSNDEQKRRQAIQTEISEGLKCRIERDWDGALLHFYKAVGKNPTDSLPRHHILVIEQLRQRELDENWDGANEASSVG